MTRLRAQLSALQVIAQQYEQLSAETVPSSVAAPAAVQTAMVNSDFPARDLSILAAATIARRVLRVVLSTREHERLRVDRANPVDLVGIGRL